MGDVDKRIVAWLRGASRPLFVLAMIVLLALVALHYREPLVQLEQSMRQALLPEARIFLEIERELAPGEAGAAPSVVGLKISGRVQAFGAPASSGLLHVVVEDIVSQHYLASGVAAVANGEFKDIRVAIPDDGKAHSAVQVKAMFRGRTLAAPNREVRVEGETNKNIGYPRRFESVSAWAIAAVVVAFALLLIALFTGTMNTRKQRSLYSVMYFVVFVSLLLPIVVSVMLLQSSYLVAIMEKAPIGLVRATSASSKTELQWFLNIGGVVTARDETSRSPRATPAAPAASAVASPSASAPASQASSPRRSETRPTTDRSELGSVSSALHGSPYIEGGLAVPFYVILLSMFGAGINLTRRVPEIQEEYSGMVPRAAPLSRSLFASSENDPAPDAETQRQTFAFRRALIQNYMYVLSAPFLATAVYYLLQVVATEPARPILVLVSFATGLISDTLVNRIVRFAEETLKLSAADKAKAMHEAANARICSINAAMTHESAKAREAHHMARITLFQRRLDEALKGGSSSLAAVEALQVPEFKRLDCIPSSDTDPSKPAAPADAAKPGTPAGAQTPATPAAAPKPAPPPGPPQPPPPSN